MDNAEEAKSLGRGKVGKGVEADMGNGRGGAMEKDENDILGVFGENVSCVLS